MEKKKRKRPDLIEQAEQIAARAWKEEGKFQCPHEAELAAIIKRLGEIGLGILEGEQSQHKDVQGDKVGAGGMENCL